MYPLQKEDTMHISTHKNSRYLDSGHSYLSLSPAMHDVKVWRSPLISVLCPQKQYIRPKIQTVTPADAIGHVFRYACACIQHNIYSYYQTFILYTSIKLKNHVSSRQISTI